MDIASDAAFQDMWLEMLLGSAISTAPVWCSTSKPGQYAPALDLAGQIIESRTKEIETMNGLLS